MNNIENRLKRQIEKNIIAISFLAIIVMGMVARFCLRDYVSGDAYSCLLPWYDEIKKNGSLKGLNIQVGNYDLLYQFFIAIFTYIPINALYAYKIFSIIFDVLLAALGAIWIKELCKGDMWKCLLAFAVIFLSPVVIMNSALWAQCDSIYGFFCILTIYMLYKKRFYRAMIFWGIAFLFKLQSVFIFPFILLLYLKSKQFSIKHFTGSLGVIVLFSIAGMLYGRGLLDTFTIYEGQINLNPQRILWNYPGFSSFFVKSDTPSEYNLYVKNMCMMLAICILGIICAWIIYRKIELENFCFLYIAFILTYAGILFVPSMHERYGYIYEILASLIMIYDKKTALLCCLLQMCSIITYSSFLFGYTYNTRYLTILNVLTFMGYIWYYYHNYIQKQEIQNLKKA